MDAPEKYTLDEAHLKFAKQINGRVWTLIAQANRTPDETAEMIEAAYASLYHWRFAGTVVNRQRGEWLIARVYVLAGEADHAMKYSQRCLDWTIAHPEQMKDFDIAFAYEGMARALALGGKIEEAKQFYARARAAGEQIADAEDKQIFEDDLKSGDWFGIHS